MSNNQYIERHILTGMIASDEFIRAIAHTFTPDILQANSAQVLSTWCLRYFQKYKKAPRKDIEVIFDSYVRREKIDKEQAADIEDILEDLSDEYGQLGLNVEVLLDEAFLYFEERRILNLADELKNDVLRGDIIGAQAQLSEYKPTEKHSIENTDFFSDDPDRTRKVFEDVPKPLIEYSGALGRLLNRHMVRGGFVAFLGPEKIGKTWTLMDIAFQAQKSGKKVAFFAAGDMNRAEMELRKYVYLNRRSNDKEYCKEMIVPMIDCWKNQSGECDDAPGVAPLDDLKERPKNWESEQYRDAFELYPEHTTCKKCIGTSRFIGAPWLKLREKVEPLTWKEAYHSERKFMKVMRGITWQFMDTASDTLTTQMMDNQLSIWHEEGFDADVILTDYPDIMTVDANDARMDFRHRENAKWKGLRGIAHKWHALMVAVTQADDAANNQKWIGRSNFSEDKRKFAHATAFFGLNQTDDEADLGLFRINQLMVRSGKRGNQFATVLQRLEQGRPHLGSF